MKSPITGKEMVLVREKRNLTFRKEEFEVVYHYYKCRDSGESFTTTELDELNINQLYNQYREKHNLPFPEKIKQIREKYGLSASKMSEVLGFGANIYRNYESGEIPSQSNARLIQLANNPEEFGKLVVYSNVFEGKGLERILQKVELIIQEEKSKISESYLERYFLGEINPNVYTGYRQPNFNKFTEMVVFFTEKVKPCIPVLNRLLFNVDFKMYNKTGLSMSGLQYKAGQSGPAPFNFQSIFEFLTNNEVVEIQDSNCSNGCNNEQLEPNPKRKFDPKQFTELELSLLEEIVTNFKDGNFNEMLNVAYNENIRKVQLRDKKIINYNSIFELNQSTPESVIQSDSFHCLCCD